MTSERNFGNIQYEHPVQRNTNFVVLIILWILLTQSCRADSLIWNISKMKRESAVADTKMKPRRGEIQAKSQIFAGKLRRTKMKYRVTISLVLGTLLLIQFGCKTETDSADTALALLGLNPPAVQNCVDFPATVVANQTSPSATTITFTCSASGLILSCTDGSSMIIEYSYPSVDVARLGVFDAPVFAPSVLFGFRGTKMEFVGNVTSTYYQDGSHRLSASSTSLGQNLTFSNYDTNGFPQDVSGDITGSVTLTYGEGGTLPTGIQGTVGGNPHDYQYSGGVMTAGTSGIIAATITTSGSTSMCQ